MPDLPTGTELRRRTQTLTQEGRNRRADITGEIAQWDDAKVRAFLIHLFVTYHFKLSELDEWNENQQRERKMRG